MIVSLLFFSNDAMMASMTSDERNALVERHITFNRDILSPRALMMVNRALQPATTAITVTPQRGGAATRRGPHANAELSLSGFYLIDCESLEEASELAAQYPMPVGMGCIEVRPALEDWDYAPNVDLNATDVGMVWAIHTDLPNWHTWMPLVERVAVPSGEIVQGAEGEIVFIGQSPARFVVACVDPPNSLVLNIHFAGSESTLNLDLSASQLPRSTVRVTHRATVPRDLLDTTGTEFSAQLNSSIRHGLRAMSGLVQVRREMSS